MSETALRQALVTAITVSVIGLAALALGAFFAPTTAESDAGRVVTSVLIRAILVIVGLAVALLLTYMTGYRIEATAQDPAPAPKPDPSASSGLLTLLTTPGSRRDSLFAGAIVMLSYWLVTTLYTIALAKFTGGQPVTLDNLWPRLGVGLICAAAGMGLAGLGARASLARRLTTAALNGARPPASAPSTTSATQPPTAPESAPGDPSAATQE